MTMKLTNTTRQPRAPLLLLLSLLLVALVSFQPTHAWVPSSHSSLLPRAAVQLSSPSSSNPVTSTCTKNARSFHSTALHAATTNNKSKRRTSTLLKVASQETTESLEAELERFQRNRRIDTLALINGAVISFLALGAAYSLFHTHVEALAALWEYDLGEHTQELTKAAVALDVMARFPVDAVRSYEQLVPQNPIFYKACTSGVAYGLGDFISQIYQGKRLENLDLPRSFRSAAAGFIGHGPLCHYWLMTMETYLDFGGAWWATGIKVTADLTVWSLFLNAAYSFIIGTLAMRPPEEVWRDIRATQWPALRSAWRFWPFVHTISFSHAVPLDLKLLWVDVMEVVWVTILSKVANEDKNAQLAKDAELQVNDCQEDFGVMPELQIELEREQELPPENLAFELPRKAWAAAWPLVAMWPVLYAGYQLEHFLGLVE